MTKSKSKILRSFLDEIGSLPMDNFLQDGLLAYTQITKQKRQEIVRKNNHQKIVNHIRSKVWPGMSVVDINRLIS
jgi:hypothetical protein